MKWTGLRHHSRYGRVRFFGLILIILFVNNACSPRQPILQPTKEIVVSVALPIEKQIRDGNEYLGTLVATEHVDLRARVTGYLTTIFLKEGIEVKKGEVIFVIDKRPFEVDLKKAQADIQVAEAQLKLNKAEVARAKKGVTTGAVSREDYDKSVANVSISEANLAIAKSSEERALLNLNYCEVKAPISGLASRALVTSGNLIQADQTILTTIVTTDPVYAYFDVDERRVQEYLKSVDNNRKDPSNGHTIPIELGLEEDEGFPAKGKLEFIENRVDPNKNAIQLRGVFYRKDSKRDLIPGYSARIRIQTQQPYPALLIPERAIGTDLGQKFVFVVNQEDKIEYRKITLGTLQNGLRDIREGIQPSDRIVINGLQRVRQGAKVEPQLVDPITELPIKKESKSK